ncbi:MAG TPA: LolA-related protein [Gammaproteobacteria bacterium]|nr:LolA-related protein [Gammaproteobacteria bacterium]
MKTKVAAWLMAFLAAFAVSGAYASATTGAPSVASSSHPLSIVHRLAQQPPTQTVFAEARFSSLLDRALVLKGKLAWQGGDRLERKVTQPYSEHTRIDGNQVSVTRKGHGTRHFSLGRAPAMKALLDGLLAVLAGNPRRLRGVFDASLQGRSDAYWTLVLVPHSPKLAHQLKGLALDGYADTLRCIEINQSGGDESIYVLGKLSSRVSARPTQSSLKTLCRAG